MRETSMEISRRNLQALTGSDVSGRLLRCMQVLRKGTAKQFSIDQLDNEVTPFVQDLRTRVLPLVLTRFCVANDIHGASKRAFEMWAKRDLGDAILRTVNALMEKPEHIRKRFVLSDLWFQAAMMEDADIFKPSSLKIIAKVLIGSQCLRAIRQVQNNLVLQGLPTNGTRP